MTTPRRLPVALDTPEQAKLLAMLEPTNTLTRLRNLAMLRVMLGYGLRSAELRTLEVRNLDLETGRMKVMGKGKRERMLRLNEADLGLIKDWLSQRSSSNPLVFTSLDGSKPVCDRWLRIFVKRLALKAGIEKDLHPHSLRHSFASKLLRHTKNLFVVSRALGHANISTTTIYLHLQDDELEEAVIGMNGG